MMPTHKLTAYSTITEPSPWGATIKLSFSDWKKSHELRTKLKPPDYQSQSFEIVSMMKCSKLEISILHTLGII